MQKRNRGTAIVIALVFGILLLQMAIVYSKIVRTAKPQTSLIDERSRVDFLANGVIEKALLKFRFLPTDFYASHDAARSPLIPAGNRTNAHLDKFIEDAALSQVDTVNDSILGETTYTSRVTGMRLHTVASETRWGIQALEITALVNFTNARNENVNRTVTRVFRVDRFSMAPIN